MMNNEERSWLSRGVRGNRGLDYTKQLGDGDRAASSTTSETVTIGSTNQSVSISPTTTFLTLTGGDGSASEGLQSVTGVTDVGHRLTIIWGTGNTSLIQSGGNITWENTDIGSNVFTAGTVFLIVWAGDATGWFEVSRSKK